jgi:4-hydroxybenzoate polyprenyltransferase
MAASQAAREEAYAPHPVAATAARPVRAGTVALLSWAVVASTLHRLRRGEGALLALNGSLIAWQAASLPQAVAQAVVSLLAIGLMYAFNDLYDAPADRTNPKKDPALVAAWADHRTLGMLAVGLASLLTIAIALPALGRGPAAAVAGVMLVNLAYSVAFKGVPVLDVVWCGLWGAVYAAIVGASPLLLVVVGLMTAVCHLFQALDDRPADARVGITTTAVRSVGLARNVLIALSALLALAAWAALGPVAAATAFVPLAIFGAGTRPATGWLLTKAYFGILWLCLLGITTGAAG